MSAPFGAHVQLGDPAEWAQGAQQTALPPAQRFPGEGAPILQHALAYARRGWEIMPRFESRGRLLDALSGPPRTGLMGEDDVFGYWTDFPETSAVALVCGPTSGVFVLDVDQHQGGEDGRAELRRIEGVHGPLPPTPHVLTPNGNGRHVYLRWPVGRRLKNGQIAPGLEILGDSMAATLPPSTKGGKPYRWSLSRHPEYLPFAEAPDWLLDLAAPPPPPTRRPPGGVRASDRYLEVALERELNTVRSARPGDRNNQLNRSAWALARFLDAGSITAGQLEALLVEAALAAGLHAREASTTVRGALRRRVAA